MADKTMPDDRGEKKRRYSILLVAAGGMVDDWLAVLTGPQADKIGVDLAGLCDMGLSPTAAADRGDGGKLPVFDSIEAGAAAGPDIAIVSSPPNSRSTLVSDALSRGMHVLSEKPIVLDETDAARLIGLTSRVPGRLGIVRRQRELGGVRQLADLVRSARLGVPQTLSVRFYGLGPTWGYRREMHHVMLREQAIHFCDSARAILRQNAVSAICIERNPAHSHLAHGAEVHALFEMSGDSLFTFSGNWCDAGPPTSENGDWRLTCAHGSARWDGVSPARAWTSEDGIMTEISLSEAGSSDTGPADSLNAFVKALREGLPASGAIRDNARSLAMMFAAIRSAKAEGRRESVHDLALAGDMHGFGPRRNRSNA